MERWNYRKKRESVEEKERADKDKERKNVDPFFCGWADQMAE